MPREINYGKQQITNEDIEAVSQALRGTLLTQGPFVNELEKKFAEYVGSKYAVAVSNGTAALHLCCLALGVKEGSKILTSPITFLASSNAVLYTGGKVEFVDIDENTFLMDLEKLESKLKSKPKGYYDGVIPVDLAGRPVDLEKLNKLSKEYDFWILEDSCHAPGAYFYDSYNKLQKCGSAGLADLCIFSLHPVKHITTGEGGIITTNSQDLYKKLLSLRSHGIVANPEDFLNKKEELGENLNEFPGWYREMQTLGYNYRLSDINAALGVSQLKRAEINLQKRQEIALYYEIKLKDIKELQLGSHDKRKIYHAYHLFIVLAARRNELYEHLKARGIYAQLHYYPVHLNPYYKNLGFNKGDFPLAEKYSMRAISLPIFPDMTREDQDYVIEQIVEFYEGFRNYSS